jgi:PAS domain S-box-containing protein
MVNYALRTIMESFSRSSGMEKSFAEGGSITNPLADLGNVVDILENAPLGVHLVDSSGKILWANKAELEFLGYSSEEYIGREFREFHADQGRFNEILETLQNGGSLTDVEVTLKHKDGSVRIGSITANGYMVDGRFEHSRCFTRDVTQKRKTEKEFREYVAGAETTKRLYEAVLSSTSDFNQAYGRDGRILYVNQALLDLWGITLEEAIGKNFFDLNYPPELAQRLEDQIFHVFATGEGVKDKTPYTSPTGVDGAYEYIFRPMFDASGKVEMVVGSTRDISEYQRTIAELRETQELLRLAMVSSRMGAWSRNITEDKVAWTPELEAIFGLEEGTFGGNEAAFLSHVLEEDRDQVVAGIREAIEARREYIIQFRFRHSDGSVRWMEGRGQAFYDDTGTPIRLFGVGIDITERKRAEDAHREHERSLEQMAAAFPQLVWMANADGGVFWYNQQWFEFTGTTLEEMEGWGWGTAHDPIVLPQVVEKWTHSVKTGDPFEMEFPLRGKDGKFQWFLNRATPMRDADGNIIRWFGTSTNIHEMRNILIRSEEANRAKDEFLAMLSHELRAPLNLMAGWSQILKATDYDEANVRKAIDVIFRNVELQSALIEDLLDVSRIVSGKIDIASEQVAFDSVVRNAVEMAEISAVKKDVGIRLTVDDSSPVVIGDKNRLAQIVNNLVNNAIKFTPSGGNISVDLATFNGFVRLKVSDDGIGIAEDMLPLIFERFRQADTKSTRAFGGLGLGLSIVESLVKVHGGRVRATSRGLDQGAEFLVELPIAFVKDPKTTDAIHRTFDPLPTALKGLRVLVVDDDKDSLELMAMFLELEGMSITRANSAPHALEQFGDAEFDLLISDLGMPEMDGYDLIRELRSSFSEQRLPAIALTGFVSESDRNKVSVAGFQAHLPKPVEFEDLITKIRELMKRSIDH